MGKVEEGFRCGEGFVKEVLGQAVVDYVDEADALAGGYEFLSHGEAIGLGS